MSEPRPATDQLIFTHQGLVRALARGIHRSFPSYIELDDLIGFGQLGLAQAARDFDPQRGFRFSTFAYYRIRGAILDGANQMNWLRRTNLAREQFDRLSSDVLALDTGDAGADEASSTAGPNWLQNVAGRLTVVFLLSQVGDDAREGTEAIEPGKDPLQKMVDDELCRTLNELLKTLPADARQLLHCTYFEGQTLKQAGEQLGISKAWASRLHARCLEQLARGLRRSHVSD
ncbi:MAG: sigma-70 family RNA polymerase sigma factor [Pirellulaceae bacterium]